MNLYWNKHNNIPETWTLETSELHVAGEVSKRDGTYTAGIAIPYCIDDHGEERDWRQADETFEFLHEAIAWVEENARWTVQGEYISFKEIAINSV